MGFNDAESGKREETLGRTPCSCAPRAHVLYWIRDRHLWNLHPDHWNETEWTWAQLREEQECVKTSCSPCPSVVIEPSVLLFLPSLYLSYLTRASVCRINATFPSRRCVEHGEKKKFFLKNAKLSGCLSSFQISAVSSLPCSYTIQEAYRLPKRALDSVVHSLGPRASATVYGVPWFSSGPKYSPHTLGISGCGGSLKRRNLLWPIRYLDFIKVEERVTSQSNHTHGLWYFNSSLVR